MLRRSFLQALVLFVLLALPASLLVLKWRQEKKDATHDQPQSAEVATPSSADETAPDGRESSEAANQAVVNGVEMGEFDQWENSFRKSGRRGAVGALREWRKRMMELPSDEAVRQLVAYLQTGRDVDLGLAFAPGENGALTTTPTLRTAAIDLLGRLDPAAAFALASGALVGPKNSADEYALHLRNYAWGAPDSMGDETLRSFLVEKTVEMIEFPAWKSAPSEGYQEAFDVLVWGDATETLPLLASLMAPNSAEALVRPSAIVIERLAVDHPAEVLHSIVESPAAWADRPDLAASTVARADLSNVSQRALVEAYFLDPERTAEARDRFLGMLPNLNLTMSYNLLSGSPTMYGHAEVLDRLRGAEVTLSAWSSDARFRAWQGEIDDALGRVRAYLAEAP